MTVLEIVTMLLAIAALFSYINQRFLRLQSAIGLMLLALVFVGVVETLHLFHYDVVYNYFNSLLAKVNFSAFVLQGILCFILFAGALNVPLETLKKQKWPIIILAIVTTLLSTFMIAGLCWFTFQMLGMPIPFLYTLIFGAIISPTDPIAALAILDSIGIPENLKVVIDGESQFNDGFGVVIFMTLTGIAFGATTPTFSGTSLLLLQEVFGGIGLGLLMAGVTHMLLRGTDDIETQLLITLASVSLTYSGAGALHVSGPIASVVLGIVVGNYSLRTAINEKSKDYLKIFWQMVNAAIVSVLFVLVGLEVLIVQIPKTFTFFILPLTIVFVLVARYVSIMISTYLLNIQGQFKLASRRKLASLLTWAGLRGALAVALVMSLPVGETRDLFLLMTFAVVVFSILVQGSTIKYLFSKQALQDMVKGSKYVGR